MAFINFINNLMQQRRLPSVSRPDEKPSSQLTYNRHRLRHALIHKKYDFISHSLPLPDLALHHLIAMSAHNISLFPKKKTLSEVPRQHSLLIPPQISNKKVFILDKRAFQAKENQVTDLKTCKSLLNTKGRTPKKLSYLFTRRRQKSSQHSDETVNSLCEITGEQSFTDPLKRRQSEDFELLPWGNNESDK